MEINSYTEYTIQNQSTDTYLSSYHPFLPVWAAFLFSLIHVGHHSIPYSSRVSDSPVQHGPQRSVPLYPPRSPNFWSQVIQFLAPCFLAPSSSLHWHGLQLHFGQKLVASIRVSSRIVDRIWIYEDISHIVHNNKHDNNHPWHHKSQQLHEYCTCTAYSVPA